MKHKSLTVERARHLLVYSRETGELRRRVGTFRADRRCKEVVSTINKDGYYVVKLDGHVYLAHRIIFFMETGRWAEPTVDHEDRDRLNNRWSNLREASFLLQTANRSIARAA